MYCLSQHQSGSVPVIASHVTGTPLCLPFCHSTGPSLLGRGCSTA
jgi:hypothetical protein